MDEGGNINQTMIINFIPTRPVEEIVREYVEAFCILFEPKQYLERAYRCFMMLGTPNVSRPFKMPKWVDLRAFLIILWRQGIRRKTRWKFWHHLFRILIHNPAVWEHYVVVCAHNEHFMGYRQVVREQVERQLKDRLVFESDV